jgi:NAD(P)-dependent dehydrogenase (short-subunit alcohol dehydrogenase family)
VGSLSENHSGGLYGYRISKAAANMAGINLAHDLRSRGIAVVCLHPGSVRTQMTAGLADQATVGALVEPAVAARGLIARIDELTLETSGTFRHANGETLPW